MAENKSLEQTVFRNFKGGLNTQDAPLGLSAHEALDLLNVRLTNDGGVGQRAGKTLWSTFGANTAHRLRILHPLSASGDSFYGVSYEDFFSSWNVFSFNDNGVATSRDSGTAGSIVPTCVEDMLHTPSGIRYLYVLRGVDSVASRKINTASHAAADWLASGNALNNFTVCRAWKNRMLLTASRTIPNRIQYSDIGDPETFGANNFADIHSSDDDNDGIVWADVVGDRFIIFKRNTVWAQYAEPPNPAFEKLGRPSCTLPYCSAVIGNRVYFAHESGVWSTDGSSAPQEETWRIRNWWRTNVGPNFEVARTSKVTVGPDFHLYVAVATGSSTANTHLLEMIPELAEEGSGAPWVLHTLPVTCLAVGKAVVTPPASGLVPRETYLVGARTNANSVDRMFLGTNDAGSAIDSYWQTPWFSSDTDEDIDRLRRLDIVLNGAATLTTYKDFLSSSSFTENVTSAGVGFVRTRPEVRGRVHSVKVRNNVLNQSWALYSIEALLRGAGH